MPNREDIFRRLKKIINTGPSFRPVGGRILKIKDIDLKSSTWLRHGKAHRRVAYEAYQNMTQYDVTRRARYLEYEIMDAGTPEISTALDIYADDSTTRNDEGSCLSIFSEDENIKEILENLFYDILNIEFNLYSWIRNVCKYGDYFVILDIHQEHGVVGCKELPPLEVEREEDYDENNPTAYRFKVVSLGNMFFESYEVAHFRLTTDTMMLPYGKSLLESGRKVWKQLSMLEDAMLIYRVSRAPERRVFKIDIGGLKPEDIPAYIEQQKNALKRTPVVDQSTGRVDYKFNPQPVKFNTIIPLLDGRNLTIRELSKEYEQGKENYVYSIQDKTNRLVPGKIKWCGKNYTSDKIVKVTLDNDGVIETAPEHPFILRDGSSVRADELKLCDSLMPLYRKYDVPRYFKNTGKYDYEKIYNPETNMWEWTHRLISNTIDETGHLHHINYNRKDNTKLKIGNWIKNEIAKENEIIYLNHKVKNIEIIDEYSDVYCMTIEGPNGEQDRHSFATQYCFVKNSVDEDFFIPIRGDKGGSDIVSLPGGCLSLDTKIKLLDGRNESLQTLIKEYQEGKTNWIYSCNPTTGRVVPGIVSWAGITQKNTKVIKLTLDNNEEIICTPDHKFPIKYKGFVEAKDLNVNDSLIPLYTKIGDIKDGWLGQGYELIFDNEDRKWKYTHRMVSEFLKDEVKTKIYKNEYCTSDVDVVHHIDFNKTNNSPENLLWMNMDDHYMYHAKELQENALRGYEIWFKNIINNPAEWKKYSDSRINTLRKNWESKTEEEKREIIEKRRAGLIDWYNNLTPEQKEKRTNISKENNKKMWESPGHYEKVFKNQILQYNDTLKNLLLSYVEKGIVQGTQLIDLINNTEEGKIFLDEFNRLNKNNVSRKIKDKFHHTHLDRLLTYCGFNSVRELKNIHKYKNHKIAKIEFLDDRIDVGTITVDQEEKYHNYHTFALSCGVFTRNSNQDAIEDVRYMQNKLISLLKIPKAYLSYEEDLCLDGDTKIKLLNGTDLSIKELSELNTLDNLYVYSIDENNNIVPGKLTKAWKTGIRNDLYEIVLDNNEKIVCTSNHPFMLRNGKYKEAKDLTINESLMSLRNKDKVQDIKNHKIKSIKKLNEEREVYDLTIDKHHNFALSSGVFVHNSGKSTLSQEDVRFARGVERIQRMVESELAKIAVIHLYVNGYEDKDLVNFELHLNNPSSVGEQLKLDLFAKELEVAAQALDSNLFSTQYIRDRLFNLSVDEMRDLDRQIIKDKKFLAKLAELEQANAMGEQDLRAAEPEVVPEEIEDEGIDFKDLFDTPDIKDLHPKTGEMSGLINKSNRKRIVPNRKTLHSIPTHQSNPMDLI